MVGRERSLGRVQRDRRTAIDTFTRCNRTNIAPRGLALFLDVMGWRWCSLWSSRLFAEKIHSALALEIRKPDIWDQLELPASAHVRTGDKVTAKYAGARCRKEGCRGRRTALFKYSRHAYPSFG